jgi:tryptophan synthase alpha chain
MNRIELLFSQLKEQNQTAFMPFITAGDPNLEFTARLIQQLDAAGCHLIELGIPYSDPIADGPVIQESYGRALQAGVKLQQIFEMLERLKSDLRCPLVLMVSIAIIHRHGSESFLRTAAAAGVAGLIIPDLPSDDSDWLLHDCQKWNLSLVQLITPTTKPERVAETLRRANGFLYYVSIAGITGERTELPRQLVEQIGQLKQQTDLPVCVGFGISRPEHIQHLGGVADGVIVGSAIVRKISEISNTKSQEVVEAEIIEYIRSMLAATRSSGKR